MRIPKFNVDGDTPVQSRRVACTAVGAVLAILTLPTLAQNYPTRPVRIVTTFSAGSGPDVMLRHVSEKLSAKWGQPVVIENRPGGSGFIAASAVRGQPADGYVLLHSDSLNFTAMPAMYKKLPYANGDFVPLTPVHRSFFYVAVASDSPYKNLSELFAAAKQPDAVTFGSWQIGSVAHLGGATLESALNTKMRHIPYRDNMQMLAAVASKDVVWAFTSLASAGPLQRSGKLRFLAYAAPERDPLTPEVPTFSEAGGPANFQLSGWVVLSCPKGLPDGLASRISADVASAMSAADIRAKMTEIGYTPTPMTPSATRDLLDKDMAVFSATAKRAGIVLE